jgi:hypothetical protein
MTGRNALATLATLATLTGCAVQPALEPRQFPDENTGASLFVVARPLTFSRSRADVAAHGRDYATLVTVAVDNAGNYSEYLLLYRWSTVDERMSPAPDPAAGELRIEADGRVLDLKPIEPPPAALAPRPQLLQPEHTNAVAHAYRTDWGMVRYLAASRTLSLRMPQESLDTPFALWEDGRGALAEFATVHPGQ